MTLIRLTIAVAFIFLTNTAVRPAGAQTPIAPLKYGDHVGGRVLVIGTVTTNPKFNYGRMQGIAEHVLEHMSDIGVDSVEVFTVDKPEKMSRLLLDGRVDWVSATPFNAVRFADNGGGEMLLAKATRGRAWYQSVFFTRKDQPLRSLDGLRGKTIAFEKPGSTSAFFIPVTMLAEAGLSLVQLDSVRDKPPKDAVGYLFSGEESNSTLWVHKGLVDAAVFSDDDWDSEYITPPKLRADLVIFERSQRLPRSVEVVRSSLPEPIKQRLKQVLLAAPEDPDATAALNQYYHATGFSEINAEMRKAFDGIRNNIGAVTELTAR